MPNAGDEPDANAPRSARFAAVVFAGGGDRCFWQAVSGARQRPVSRSRRGASRPQAPAPRSPDHAGDARAGPARRPYCVRPRRSRRCAREPGRPGGASSARAAARLRRRVRSGAPVREPAGAGRPGPRSLVHAAIHSAPGPGGPPGARRRADRQRPRRRGRARRWPHARTSSPAATPGCRRTPGGGTYSPPRPFRSPRGTTPTRVASRRRSTSGAGTASNEPAVPCCSASMARTPAERASGPLSR